MPAGPTVHGAGGGGAGGEGGIGGGGVSQGRSARRNAFVIMGAILGSRVLGLVREVVLNAVIGPGMVLDAFYAAFRIPNLLRDLFAEGALSTAFVTVFSKKLAGGSREAAFRLANQVLVALMLTMVGICVVGMVFSPQLVSWLNPGFAETEGKMELTSALTRMLFPFIALVSFAAVFMGLLNSLGSFGLPASASTVFNAVSILTGLTLAWWMDPKFGEGSIYGFAGGTLLGGLAQWLVLVPRAVRFGYHPAWVVDWRDQGFREVIQLMVPAVVGGAAVQVNVLVNGYFASFLGDGAVTWLNNAFRLMQLPIGLFGVAIATVTLPEVSRLMAGEQRSAFRGNVSEALRRLFFLNFPASVGLFLLAEPVIRVVFERGAFTAEDTEATARVLQAYAIGLGGYGGIKVLAPTFAALRKAWIPMRVSLLGIGLNVGLNLLFLTVLKLGVAGLALATSSVALLNFGQLAWALRREVGNVLDRETCGSWFRVVVAGLVMGLVVGWMNGRWEVGPFWWNAFGLGLTIAVGLGVYGATSWVLGIEEFRGMVRGLVRRLRR
ncbi:MAG: murein biosynthesis integral membrane protein MurJ [Verrucomicrobiia bacterium]